MLPPPLAPLAVYPQFVAWRIEQRLNSAGLLVPTKVPYSPITGYGASSADPSHWGTYDQAVKHQQAMGMDGIGFVFTERDPFFFLDIDKSLQNGAWSMLSQELCARFPGAAVEVSWSGTGLHIIGSCTKGFVHGSRNDVLHLEFYTKERFVALTGTQASGSVLTNMDAAVAPLVTQFFTKTVGDRATEWTSVPVAEWRGPADDGELITKAMLSAGNSAAAVMGSVTQPTFADLFTANADVLALRWPPNPNSGDRFNHSDADQSFANMLAFWTGKDCERMERIMRVSGLMRAKWDLRTEYLSDTILNACGFVRNVYQQRESASPTPAGPPVTAEEVIEAGFEPRHALGTIVLANMQMGHFAGCIYVTSLNKVLTPDGDLLDQARFNVHYGGHTFALSADNRATTTSAWTAFTESGHFSTPIAHRLCFRPEHGSVGIILDSGKRLANAYYPAETEMTEGDASPFLNHVQKMLPHGRDAEILLHYMASVKQNPGMKAQWWPVIQGAEGNFKSFFLTIMAFAVGSHYSHMPNMEKMVNGKSNFNGWIERKLFLGLDEVYASNRREFFEGFKTTVTNRVLPIEGKGIEELTGDNRANGVIVTNWQDGVPIVGKSRRFAPFFCAQQTPEDMLRDGMTASYILNLKNWLLGIGDHAHHGPDYGLRVMNWYLSHKVLEAELDPNQLSIRCPETTATKTAILAGQGRVEQEIVEAIEEERPGFAGGWVSSIYLDRLMKDLRHSVAYQKRRELMQSLGYDYHPALPDGRANNAVMPDAGKPRLFVKLGSIQHLNLTEGHSVGRAYTEAQNRAAGERSAAGLVFTTPAK